MMLMLALSACVPSVEHPNSQTDTGNSPTGVRVFADIALEDSLSEIAQNYKLIHPDSTVTLSFSNSKHLRELIEQGKSVDLFVSSIPAETTILTNEGTILAADTKTLATSRLVVAVPAGNPGKIQSAKDLSRPGMKLGIIAETKPMGEQTRTALANLNATYGAGYMDLVMANVTATEEDAKAILDKLKSGELDACIVNSFEAVNQPDIAFVDFPAEANVHLTFDISILAKSKNYDEAGNFMNYVLSPEGLAVLTKWGFTVQ